MSPCQEFEAIIDAATQPDEQQIIRLTKHLSECESCREYQQQARLTQSVFARLQGMYQQDSHRDSLLAKVMAKANETRKQVMGAFAGAMVALVAMGWFYFGVDQDVKGAVVMGCWAVGTLLYGAFIAVRNRRFMEVTGSLDQSVFETWQRDLKWKIGLIKYFGSTVLALMVTVWLAVWMVGVASTSALIIFAIIDATIAGFILYQFAMVLPRHKAELSMLEKEWL